MQVSIDGPAGAGKSSVAKALASALGYIHIDTGAMYRALTWLALREGVPLTDEEGLGRLAEKAEITFRQEAPGEIQRVYCQGEDVTEVIRGQEVSQGVSLAAKAPGVRAAMTRTQRQLASGHDVVMDGRDIGTVVLPKARCKLYLTASPEERAARRWKEIGEKDGGQTLAGILRDIEKRDYEDTHRSSSPLKPAEDSILLDSTNMSFPQVVEKALALVRARSS